MTRLDTYKELEVLKETENKKITIVRSEIDSLCYIKREISVYSSEVYEILLHQNIPSIPKIHYLEKRNQKLMIIEDYINMPTLDVYMANHIIDEQEAKHIILLLCKPLKELHHLSLVHRDIKAENVFYNGKEVYLFDFDIMRKIEKGKKKDTVIMGTENYASPEQYGFFQSDERSDIYSLGVLFFYLLTSHFPTETTYLGKYQSLLEQMLAMDPKQRISTIEKVEKRLLGKIDFTLPGFRHHHSLHQMIAGIVYILIISFSMYFIYYDQDHYRGMILCMFILGSAMLVISFITNYLDIQKYALFYHSDKALIRKMGILVSMILSILLWFGICSLLMSINF